MNIFSLYPKLTNKNTVLTENPMNTDLLSNFCKNKFDPDSPVNPTLTYDTSSSIPGKISENKISQEFEKRSIEQFEIDIEEFSPESISKSC